MSKIALNVGFVSAAMFSFVGLTAISGFVAVDFAPLRVIGILMLLALGSLGIHVWFSPFSKIIIAQIHPFDSFFCSLIPAAQLHVGHLVSHLQHIY